MCLASLGAVSTVAAELGRYAARSDYIKCLQRAHSVLFGRHVEHAEARAIKHPPNCRHILTA